MNDEVFSRLIAPVTRGIRLLFGRGVLTGTHDELKMQNVQLTGMDGETFDDVERPQQYGQISVLCRVRKPFCLSGRTAGSDCGACGGRPAQPPDRTHSRRYGGVSP